MTKKKVTLVLEGNSKKVENMVHELSKLTDQANREPEFMASIQTQELDDNDYTKGFTKANE